MKLLAIAAALAATPLLYLGATTAPAFAACGDSSSSGDNVDGSWTKSYDPNCATGVDGGDVTVVWHNGTYSNGHRWVSYQFTLSAHNLASGDCVQIALDWDSSNESLPNHSDAQIMRNCFENSRYTMEVQKIDLDADGITSYGVMRLRRLQVSTYTGGNVKDPACPGDLAYATANGQCDTWSPDGDFTSTARKVRRWTAVGNDQENDPVYPQYYSIRDQLTT